MISHLKTAQYLEISTEKVSVDTFGHVVCLVLFSLDPFFSESRFLFVCLFFLIIGNPHLLELYVFFNVCY